MRLEDLLTQPPTGTSEASANVLELTDVQDEDYMYYWSEPLVDIIIDDGGVSGNRSGIDHLIQMEEDELNRMIKSSEKSNIDNYFEEHQVFEKAQYPDYLVEDPEIVGYPDLEMQDTIYKWVASGLPYTGYSVKDLGAGRGDFIKYLNPGSRYIGIESKKALVMIGKDKYEGIELIHGDYFNMDIKTDYTIIVGTLNENNNKDKWEHFNLTLNKALESTNTAIIFILARNMDGNTDYFDYPFEELFLHLRSDLRFTVDYTHLEDIYRLTVHIGGYN